MSFRVRVLALVGVVAVTAVAATAYLTYTQSARQITASAVADYQTSQQIITELTAYAHDHGTWAGVVTAVAGLAERTGQRIRLETDGLVADSDTVAGGQARVVTALPIAIDPRPVLDPAGISVLELVRLPGVTASAIARYRHGVLLADCLTRHGLGVAVAPGEYGTWGYGPTEDARITNPAKVLGCTDEAGSTEASAADQAEAEACRTSGRSGRDADRAIPPPPKVDGQKDPIVAMADCLKQLFARRTADVGPLPLRLYLGAAEPPGGGSLTPGPIALAAGLVAVLALGGTFLLSRRVLRPINALTVASQRLGAGSLGQRVPARGRDEVAQLAQSFNRMADSLQQSEHQQRQLIADVAHELRTPLSNLRGYLEALKDGVIPADPTLFADLYAEAVLQQRIVDDLQDLALAEAGSLAYHRTDVDLAELLLTCHTAHHAAAEAAGVDLRVVTDGAPLAEADPDRLRQVVGNLVTNALRATPPGGSVTLRAVGYPDRCVIEVVDTGTGIAPSDLPHIFDRFWRPDSARGRATGGCGLGLAIARQIVLDHSGQIIAESEPGRGTIITITLPPLPASSPRRS